MSRDSTLIYAAFSVVTFLARFLVAATRFAFASSARLSAQRLFVAAMIRFMGVGSENSNTCIRGRLLSMRCHAIMADHMRTVLDPFRFLLVAVSGWMNQRQLEPVTRKCGSVCAMPTL